MKVLFAMDLIGGKTVRLQKGDFEKVTVYSDDPVGKIAEMIDMGARDFHIIDLDGARTGRRVHHDIIARMRAKIKDYMEVGGGIRSEADVSFYRELGINGVIVGTQPLEDDAFFNSLSRHDNIVLGLDLLNGVPMVRGWKAPAGKDVKKIIETSERIGVTAILCTSIARDGMLSGPDYESLKSLIAMTKTPIIAAGGVTTIDDVKRLADMGAWAAVLGKAVYEGLIKIDETVRYAG